MKAFSRVAKVAKVAPRGMCEHRNTTGTYCSRCGAVVE